MAFTVPSADGQATASRTLRTTAKPSNLGAPSSRTLSVAPSFASLAAPPVNVRSPSAGNESLFDVPDNPFAFTPGNLSKLMDPKSVAGLQQLGGLTGLEKGLRTDREKGLSVGEAGLPGMILFDDAVAGKADIRGERVAEAGPFGDRRRVFGANRVPDKKPKSVLDIAWGIYNDKLLLLLTAAAIVSLALGIYESRTNKGDEPHVEWVDGLAIVAAILTVVGVGTMNDWQKEKQFQKLSRKKEDRQVTVLRSGQVMRISVFDVLVGDVLRLEPGDIVPVDGVYISGHNLRCDESTITGESELIRKAPGDVRDTSRDPFILSGSKVAEGTGTLLVTAVGVNSTYGKTMAALKEDVAPTPLQQKLNFLADRIAKFATWTATLLFAALIFKRLLEMVTRKDSNVLPFAQRVQGYIRIMIVSVTLVVVAVPEGLPLAVTLALAFATTRMMRDNNLVRVLRACETMGGATVVCSDKTGTLTENKMRVVAGAVGGAGSSEVDLAAANFPSRLHPSTKDLLRQSIALNSTAFQSEGGFVGSTTEAALLSFAQDRLAALPVHDMRAAVKVVDVVPFDSGAKFMATAVAWGSKTRILLKGAPELLLPRCAKRFRNPALGLEAVPLTDADREDIDTLIEAYASSALRTLAFVYADVDAWPPAGGLAAFNALTFIGVLGLRDAIRPGVTDAVAACQSAGVRVLMVTGDNIHTAVAIAMECGIHDPSTGFTMEGAAFRVLTAEQLREVVPRLQVLARSSPEDKKVLVRALQEAGETVAVTGDGTNDAPALRGADVGFAMGGGTEVAKEASDIILLDDNFASIVKALMWGRTVNEAVRRFLQFQICVNITAVLITFITALTNRHEESVLTAVQLLWVNLIMDTFAALALATDPPTSEVLQRPPDRKSAPLITLTMWKMIVGQALYHLLVTLGLYYGGSTLFGYNGPRGAARLNTVVFNTFVWLQICNEYNSRRLDNRLNIFAGMWHNHFLLLISAVMIAGQVLIVTLGGVAFGVVRLRLEEWVLCLMLGLTTWPVGVLLRTIPDAWIGRMISKRWRAGLVDGWNGGDAESEKILLYYTFYSTSIMKFVIFATILPFLVLAAPLSPSNGLLLHNRVPEPFNHPPIIDRRDGTAASSDEDVASILEALADDSPNDAHAASALLTKRATNESSDEGLASILEALGEESPQDAEAALSFLSKQYDAFAGDEDVASVLEALGEESTEDAQAASGLFNKRDETSSGNEEVASILEALEENSPEDAAAAASLV
ncbi:calcium-translocating P-type ATPase [Trichodelitschia bisporula]|uniref:Calcium-transporting ATPase n=1 Tax=Trichodelitschia bisporula TaxID=703511 RepID=A0A6G1HVR7_9PEZI|nr:calcium-translocating P-type ATPase [Trichodelitschia bisporula]